MSRVENNDGNRKKLSISKSSSMKPRSDRKWVHPVLRAIKMQRSGLKLFCKEISKKLSIHSLVKFSVVSLANSSALISYKVPAWGHYVQVALKWGALHQSDANLGPAKYTLYAVWSTMYDTRVQVVVGASHGVLTWASQLAQGHRLKMLWQKIMHCTPCFLHSSKVELYANFFAKLKIAAPGLVTTR